MKKFITLDEAAICFFSATGYGLGLLIPEFFGLPTVLNIICCFALLYVGIFPSPSFHCRRNRGSRAAHRATASRSPKSPCPDATRSRRA